MTLGAIDRVLHDDDAWFRLVQSRRLVLARFLRWASACEAGAREVSLRLDNRDDIVRCRDVLGLFDDPWWGVVVYSCFDSSIGTRVAAPHFRAPLKPVEAEQVLTEIEFPQSSVQHHRAQSTLAGARRSLISACEKADAVHGVLFTRDVGFDERFDELMKVHVSWWGRTTCFDALLRAGALRVSGEAYRPERAYLLGSQGPAAGFECLWGVRVTVANADACEGLLSKWSATWEQVAAAVGVEWHGTPYDSADFENALCVFQEPPHRGMPDPADFAAH